MPKINTLTLGYIPIPLSGVLIKAFGSFDLRRKAKPQCLFRTFAIVSYRLCCPCVPDRDVCDHTHRALKKWLNMEKVWFIKVDDAEEGPFTPTDLKRHPRITPDTLVRKDGSSQWTPIRYVAELKEIFDDAPLTPTLTPSEDETLATDAIQVEKDELLLDCPYDSPPFLFWLLMMLIVLIYTSYQLYLKR
jgi:hypothetical protein